MWLLLAPFVQLNTFGFVKQSKEEHKDAVNDHTLPDLRLGVCSAHLCRGRKSRVSCLKLACTSLTHSAQFEIHAGVGKNSQSVSVVLFNIAYLPLTKEISFSFSLWKDCSLFRLKIFWRTLSWGYSGFLLQSKKHDGDFKWSLVNCS